MKKYLASFFGILMYLTSTLFIISKPAEAQEFQETPCGKAQYTAFIQLQNERFNAFVKSGRKEDVGKAQLYYGDLDKGDCLPIGSGKVNLSNYVGLGELDLASSKPVNFGSLYLLFDKESKTDAGASAPQLVLTKKTSDTPCDITEECVVKFKDKEFELSPRKISLENDNLLVGLLEEPALKIVEVIYSVDGRPAYTKKTLEDFNLNYVPNGEHTVTRTIVLQDGQSLTDSRVVSRGLEGGITYLLISILYGQSKLLRYLLIIVGLYAVYFLVLLGLKKINSKKRWKKQHFFDPSEHYDMSKAGAKLNISTDDTFGQIFNRYKNFMYIGTIILALVLFMNAYVITIFKVRGVSMDPTLKDGSRNILLTLPVNIGRLNDNYYLPSRGVVVVVKQGVNNLFDSVNDADERYVVKRVVGLPKDRVVINKGKIIIYNKTFPKGFEPDAKYGWVRDLNGSQGIAMDITLKDGEIFLIGDNRDGSIDSRFYGPISTSKVVGIAL